MKEQNYSEDSRLQKVICKDCANLEFYCGYFCLLNHHEKEKKSSEWRKLLNWMEPLEYCKDFIPRLK